MYLKFENQSENTSLKQLTERMEVMGDIFGKRTRRKVKHGQQYK